MVFLGQTGLTDLTGLMVKTGLTDLMVLLVLSPLSHSPQR
jgi:hypothetical protein